MLRNPGKLTSTRAIPLLLALLLTACGAGFKEGAYVDTRSGTTYEFGPDGQGRMTGGVSGAPAFTYTVQSDQLIVEYASTPGAPAMFRRVDDKTLERADGTRLALRE